MKAPTTSFERSSLIRHTYSIDPSQSPRTSGGTRSSGSRNNRNASTISPASTHQSPSQSLRTSGGRGSDVSRRQRVEDIINIFKEFLDDRDIVIPQIVGNNINDLTNNDKNSLCIFFKSIADKIVPVTHSTRRVPKVRGTDSQDPASTIPDRILNISEYYENLVIKSYLKRVFRIKCTSKTIPEIERVVSKDLQYLIQNEPEVLKDYLTKNLLNVQKNGYYFIVKPNIDIIPRELIPYLVDGKTNSITNVAYNPPDVIMENLRRKKSNSAVTGTETSES